MFSPQIQDMSSLELLLEHALNRTESLANAVCLETLPLCTQSDRTEPLEEEEKSPPVAARVESQQKKD